MQTSTASLSVVCCVSRPHVGEKVKQRAAIAHAVVCMVVLILAAPGEIPALAAVPRLRHVAFVGSMIGCFTLNVRKTYL